MCKKVIILKDDVMCRYRKDEEGILLENNFKKYDYFVRLEPTIAKETSFWYRKGQPVNRDFYFYKDEIKILGE